MDRTKGGCVTFAKKQQNCDEVSANGLMIAQQSEVKYPGVGHSILHKNSKLGLELKPFLYKTVIISI